MKDKNKEKRNKTIDIIIMAIIVIIIILLLIHNCTSLNKKNDGNTDVIDICDEDDENCDIKPGSKGNKIDCLKDVDNPVCVVPNFVGKTKEDVYAWLEYISNNIELTYDVVESDKDNGIIIDQSTEEKITVKDLLEKNIPLLLTFANSKNTDVDCLNDSNNKKCVIPDFTGKTKEEVLDFFNSISNNINIKFSTKKSEKYNGVVIGQSVKKGTKIKDILNDNKLVEIVFANNDKVDCLKDEDNPVCIIPNFTGDTKKELEDWLNSIANDIDIDFVTEESKSKNGTITNQSMKNGKTVKDLLESGEPLTITLANREDTKVDCTKTPNSKACIIPDFTGKTKEDVQKWLDGIVNDVIVNYEVVDSDQNNGEILSQSNKNTSVNDLINGNTPLNITVANNKNVKVDCITDVNNPLCVVPDFTGKTKKDVEDWLNKIANDLNKNYKEEKSDKENGEVLSQSIEKGTLVKDLIENNTSLDIVFSNNDKVNCLVDVDNPVCIIPNFTGDTKEDIQRWLDSISNTIPTKYTTIESDAKKGTVVEQSNPSGMTVKELLDSKQKLEILFAEKDESKVDCLKDVDNPLCVVPDFKGKTKKEIKEWLDSISNDIKVEYQKEKSNEKNGRVINQSIESGTNVKDIINNKETLIITVSDNKEKPVNPTEPEEDLGEVIVKDDSVTWSTNTELNIFANPLYDNQSIVAPESSNTYQFVLFNNTKTSVKYSIKFIETNPNNMNMKYKLRKNNSYIIDTYVSASELNLNNILIDVSKSDTFYLEWKWISSDNDTDVQNTNYSLRIEIDAEGVQ